MKAIVSVLLDRDGTIIEDKHYLGDPAGVTLLSGAAEGLAMLQRVGLELFLVTNQSGIERGYYTAEDYRACNKAMDSFLAREGVRLTGGAFCPHAPETACACRKPELGMWHELRQAYGLNPATSAMIGDKMVDIAFGLAAGFLATILVLTGKGAAEAKKMELPPLAPDEAYRIVPAGDGLRPHAIAHTLIGAAQFILGQND